MHTPPAFLAICPLSLSVSTPPSPRLCALKLIVMRHVVCQSWWWICLWVEGADFPWVVLLSLPLFPSVSFYAFLLISPSNQTIRLPPGPPPPPFPYSAFGNLQGASPVWHLDLMSGNPELKRSPTITLHKGKPSQISDHFLITTLGEC